MMPTIRVDEEVLDWLKEQAEPFVDTPNSVLRRFARLDIGDEPAETPTQGEPRRRRPASNRARSGELLDRKEYDLRILAVLDRMGGAGHAPDVVAEVGKLVSDRLTATDRERIDSGVVRWENRVMWRRFRLKKLGLLKADSPRGIWEISDRGREALERGVVEYT